MSVLYHGGVRGLNAGDIIEYHTGMADKEGDE